MVAGYYYLAINSEYSITIVKPIHTNIHSDHSSPPDTTIHPQKSLQMIIVGTLFGSIRYYYHIYIFDLPHY